MDKNSLRTAAKLSFAMALTTPLGLLLRFMVPRFLGNELAGEFFFAESFPLMLLSLMPLGIGAYIQQNVPAHPERARQILTPIGIFQFGLGVLLILSLILFMIISNYSEVIIGLTAIMASNRALLIFQSEVIQKTFFGLGIVDPLTKSNVISKFAVVLLVFGSLALGGGAFSVALAFLLVQFGAVVQLLAVARRHGLLGAPFRWVEVRAMISRGLPFLFGTVLACSNSSVDSVLMARLAGYTEISYYGVAQRLSGLCLLLVPLLISAVMPDLSRAYTHDRQHFQRSSQSTLRVLTVFCFVSSMAFVCLGKEIIILFFGQSFAPAATSTLIFGPTTTLLYFSVFLYAIGVITTNGKKNAFILMCGLILNALLDYLLIGPGLVYFGPGGGAVGCAFATLVAEAFICICLVQATKLAPWRSRETYLMAAAVLPPLIVVPFCRTWFDISLPLRGGGFILLVPMYLFLARLVSMQDIVTGMTAVRKIVLNRLGLATSGQQLSNP